jgi:imidazolonepropionase-like amidohydrolase
MPGLIDARTHLSFGDPTGNDELFNHRTEGYSSMVSAYNARKVLRAEVTSVLDAGCLWNIAVEPRDARASGSAAYEAVGYLATAGWATGAVRTIDGGLSLGVTNA